jgi:hypothetical protein
MTTITLELPDDIAKRAGEEGLLAPERFRELLEEALTRGPWRHDDGLGNPARDETKASARRRPCAQLANSARLHDELIRSGDTGDWESA